MKWNASVASGPRPAAIGVWEVSVLAMNADDASKTFSQSFRYDGTTVSDLQSQVAACIQQADPQAMLTFGTGLGGGLLTSAQLTAMQPFVDPTQTDAANVAALNTANVANPTPAAQVPQPMTTEGLFALLLPQE